MARVTVEDCVEKVINRFELVVLAAERAKRINAGAPITVDRDNDKDGVVALREIVEYEDSDIEKLREGVISRLQKLNKIDDIESDDDLPLGEEIGDDFEYISDGEGFLMDDDHSEVEEEDEVLENISEEANPERQE